MPITPLPPVPLRSDAAEVFVEKADTFMAALPTFATEANSVENALQTSTVIGTSTTSLTLGTGSKTLTTQTGKGWIVGSWLYIVCSTAITNTMQGQVTAYNSGTGSLTVNVTSIYGSGTFANWAIGLSVTDGKLNNAVDVWLLAQDNSQRMVFASGSHTTIKGYGSFPLHVINSADSISLSVRSDGRSTLGASGTEAMDATTVSQIQKGAHVASSAGGTADNITATFSPQITDVVHGTKVLVRATAANTSATPTITVGSSATLTICKSNNSALLAGDIPGSGYWCEFVYDSTFARWVLMNPAKGVNPQIAGGAAGSIPYQTAASTTGVSAAGTSGQLLQSSGAGAPTWVTSPWSAEVAAITPVTVAQLPTQCTGEDHYACVNISTSDNRLIGWGRSGGWGNPSGSDDGEGSAAGWAFYPPIPDGVSIVGHTAASGMSTFVWLSNGWAYSGGYNSQGQLGHGDTTNRLWLKRVEYFVTNSISIAEVVCTGSRYISTDIYAMWRTSAGHVYYSGISGVGSAGDSGSTATRVVSTPTRCGTITGITGIATSSFSCFAWSASATYSWGFNDYGELGIGNNVSTSTVQTITGLVVSKVATYVNTNQTPNRVGHTLFLLTDGTVKATGHGAFSQIGDGVALSRNVPTVVTGLTGVVDLGCAGADNGYNWAITSGGSLYVWGANNCGQLGLGNTTNQATATTPVGYVTKSGGVVTTGSPPFQGTVVQVQAGKMNSAVYASGCVYVLDSSGKVWVSGNDATMTYDTTTVSNLTRFSECSIAKLPTGEKIVKLRHHGHHDSSTTRVFALTNRGRLLVAGNNTYGCALGGDTPGSEQLWVKTFTPVDIRGMNL